MSNDGQLSRRAYLAASVAGAGLLAGCPGGSETNGEAETATDTASATDTETATDTATDAETDTETPEPSLDPDEVGQSVLVDQEGYRPGDAKVGMVRTEAETFALFDVETGDVVTEGSLSDPIEDDNSGDTVRQADFSGVTEPGRYRLAVDEGTVASHEFRIAEDVWGQTLAEIGRAYTLRRSNTAIDDSVTGIQFGPGHPQDAEAQLYFDGEFHDKGDTLDMTKGWYDAGDYGKYVPPAAATLAHLMLAFEQNTQTLEQADLGVDAALGEADPYADLPDVLSEVRYELDWLGKMQRPDGSVYHKVSGAEWPGFVRPTEDTQTRYVYGHSTFGTGQFAGTMALASRVFSGYDDEFAAQALERAREAFSFLQDNPDPIFRFDEGQNSGSGGYAKETDAEERFWAAAELLRTTGEQQYADYVHDEHADFLEAPPTYLSWANTLMAGQWAYYNADAAPADRREALAEQFTATADEIVAHVESEGYNVSLTSDQYIWASAKAAVARGVILLLANEMDPDEAYVAAALDQLHYVLGRTPTTKAYLTGAGENPAQNTHDRIRASTGTYVPGHLVGGPNADGGDPELDALIEEEDPAPAKCYLDQQGSWASNEPAIDYSAPVFHALSFFVSGDAVSPQ